MQKYLVGFPPSSTHFALDLIIWPCSFSFLMFSSYVLALIRFVLMSVMDSSFSIFSISFFALLSRYLFYRMNMKLSYLLFPWQEFLKISSCLLSDGLAYWPCTCCIVSLNLSTYILSSSKLLLNFHRPLPLWKELDFISWTTDEWSDLYPGLTRNVSTTLVKTTLL